MNRERNELKAGIFIVVSFLAAVGIVVLIRGDGAGPSQVRTATFSLSDDLGGLAVGDDVRVGGVKVGTIRDIHFDGLGTSAGRVLVSFSIPATYQLHEDAQVAVQTALTGPPDLNIVSVGTGKALGENQSVTGQPDPKTVLFASLGRLSPQIDAISSSLATQTVPSINQTLASIHATSDSANALIGRVDQKIDPAVQKYNDAISHADQTLVQVRDVLGDTRTDIRTTIKNLSDASGKFSPLVEKATALIDRVDTAITNARTTLEDIKVAAANTKDLTATGRSIVIDNRTKIDSIIHGLKITSDNLKETSVEVLHSPWRLLYKPAPEEMANLNLFDTTRQFSDGAASLSDAAGALRDALRDPAMDKAQVQKLVQQLDESFRNFHAVENKLWAGVK